MQIPGKDGVDYINIGPGALTMVGYLLHLSTERWFITPDGKCLTLIGYHYYNSIKFAIDAYGGELTPDLRKSMQELLSINSSDAKKPYNRCLDILESQVQERPKHMDYPSEWQIPSIYARLSMLHNPIEEFYGSKLPIVWLDRNGKDLCDGLSKIGNYVDVLLKLRNDHAKYLKQ